jgi:hypothetical protein
LFAALEVLRDRLLTFLVLPLRVAFLALVIRPAFLALVSGPAFLALVSVLAFLALVRLLVALPAERRAGFSVVVAGAAAGCAGVRPNPIFLANWDRRSE